MKRLYITQYKIYLILIYNILEKFKSENNLNNKLNAI